MNRFQAWAAGLHVGQLVLLVPALLLVGALALGGTAFISPSSSEAATRLQEARDDLSETENKLISLEPDEFDKALLRRKKAARWDELVEEGLSADSATVQVEREFYVSAERYKAPGDLRRDGDRLVAAGFTDAEIGEYRAQLKADSLAQADRLQKATRDNRRAELFQSILWWSGVAIALFATVTAFFAVWCWFGSRAKAKGDDGATG
jgi:hypothetical protein